MPYATEGKAENQVSYSTESSTEEDYDAYFLFSKQKSESEVESRHQEEGAQACDPEGG